ncbi:MAG: hypothetical protein DRJ65_00900 [Acidobacteria bacterium]|nr:MAG: hypothetical protein DRJ65_00900 [Acidobacteriota bacterium]
MLSRPNPNSLAAIVTSWLAALSAGIVTLGIIACGQGVGAMLGGCRWIGVTLPLHRQPWALVNQPSLAFSTDGAAIGYWLGGTLACLLVATLVIPFVPRLRGLTSELLAIQISWMASVLGLGWMALLDPWDGHLSRSLRLHEMSPALVWLLPVLGAWAALIPTLRLLALVRGAQPQLGRSGRVLTVVIHLVLPACVWITGGLVMISRTSSVNNGTLLEGLLPFEALWPPVLAAALPSVAALTMAWLAFPRAWVHHLEPVSLRSGVLLMVCAAALVGFQLTLGGPSGQGTCRGVLWAHANSRNNLRPWVTPVSILGASALPGIDDSSPGGE